MIREASKGEATFAFQCRALKLPAPIPEYRFDQTRKWRFDFAWPDMLIAVEIEGGLFGTSKKKRMLPGVVDQSMQTQQGGRHTRGAGYQADLDKYNAATLANWAVYRFSTADVLAGKAIEIVGAALAPFLNSSESTSTRASACAQSVPDVRAEKHQ